jgi:hypothetical protein
VKTLDNKNYLEYCSWKMLGQFFREISEFALLIDPEFIFAPRFEFFDEIS